MGWIIFAVWMILGIVINIFISIEKNAQSKKEKRQAKRVWSVCMWILIVLIGLGLLYLLGWIWYYFCCGFLVFEEPSFIWKIIWGLFSLVPLGFIIGLIAICFGWDPRDNWW